MFCCRSLTLSVYVSLSLYLSIAESLFSIHQNSSHYFFYLTFLFVTLISMKANFFRSEDFAINSLFFFHWFYFPLSLTKLLNLYIIPAGMKLKVYKKSMFALWKYTYSRIPIPIVFIRTLSINTILCQWGWMLTH